MGRPLPTGEPRFCPFWTLTSLSTWTTSQSRETLALSVSLRPVNLLASRNERLGTSPGTSYIYCAYSPRKPTRGVARPSPGVRRRDRVSGRLSTASAAAPASRCSRLEVSVRAVLLQPLLGGGRPGEEPQLRAEPGVRAPHRAGAACQVKNRAWRARTPLRERPWGDGREAEGAAVRDAELVSAAGSAGEGPGPQPFALRVPVLFQAARESVRPVSRRGGRRPRACGDSGQQPLHPGVDEGEAPEQVLVHAVEQPAVGGGQPRPLAEELLVEVAAVARRFLGGRCRGDRREENQPPARCPCSVRGHPGCTPGGVPNRALARGRVRLVANLWVIGSSVG